MNGGASTDIAVKLKLIDHNDDPLDGFEAWLYVWGRPDVLDHKPVPCTPNPVTLVTQARGETGKLVFKGPASQDHKGIVNFGYTLSVPLNRDSFNTFKFVECPDVEADTNTGSAAILGHEKVVGPEDEDDREIPALASADTFTTELLCKTIRVSVINHNDPSKVYFAQPQQHDAEELCNVKQLALKPSGHQDSTFHVRQARTTTYVDVWEQSAPSDIFRFYLKNTFESYYIHMKFLNSVVQIGVQTVK